MGRDASTPKVFSDCPESEEHTSELQSRLHLVCRLLLEKKNQNKRRTDPDVPPRECGPRPRSLRPGSPESTAPHCVREDVDRTPRRRPGHRTVAPRHSHG